MSKEQELFLPEVDKTQEKFNEFVERGEEDKDRIKDLKRLTGATSDKELSHIDTAAQVRLRKEMQGELSQLEAAYPRALGSFIAEKAVSVVPVTPEADTYPLHDQIDISETAEELAKEASDYLQLQNPGASEAGNPHSIT